MANLDRHIMLMNRAVEVGTDFFNGQVIQYAGACIADNNYQEISAERVRHPIPGLGEDALGQNHLYACHAELRAIVAAYEKGENLKNCIIYCTHHPCVYCGPLIIKSGITRVIYKERFSPEFNFTPFETITVQSYDDVINAQ